MFQAHLPQAQGDITFTERPPSLNIYICICICIYVYMLELSNRTLHVWCPGDPSGR